MVENSCWLMWNSFTILLNTTCAKPDLCFQHLDVKGTMKYNQNCIFQVCNCLKCMAVIFFWVLFVSSTHFCCSIRSRSSSILLLSSSSLLSLSSSSRLRFSSSFCNRSRSSSSRRLRSSSSLLQHPLNKPFQHSYNPRMSYFQHAVTCPLPAQWGFLSGIISSHLN